MRSGTRPLLDRLAPRSAAVAAAWFVVLAVIFTWPVAARPGHVVPGDHGDPLLNCWILAWNADHLLRALGGEISALTRIWHGNIFHPEPYTLGYSELLLAQAVQILPVYAATGNILLCYNLLLISSYALSGLGMFLLVRQLTGDWRSWRGSSTGSCPTAWTRRRTCRRSRRSGCHSCSTGCAVTSTRAARGRSPGPRSPSWRRTCRAGTC
jgi:hypothetical protein